jgi:Ca2+-binding RTX toxin-like protein
MRWIAGAGALATLLLAAPAGAATLEPVGNFTNPTYVSSYPNDAGKLLVVERAGQVRLVEGGTTSLFLDASSLVGTIDGGQGMWSVALAPDFETTGKLYAVYAGSATDGDVQLDEFTAAGNAVDLATRRPVLTIEHTGRLTHHGGQLQFGADGNLYISSGDAARSGTGQRLDVLLGKVLRIDPRQSGVSPYTIPADNPFVGVAGEDEIWSYGLRNPYRFSFDRLTGALSIGDVGRVTIEEVDYDPGPDPGRGDNYGWPCYEGSMVLNTDPICANPQNLVFPIHEMHHDDGFCSVIGGYVARDPSLGDLVGRYVYADLCEGLIRSMVPAVPQASGDRSEGLAVNQPVSFGEDACGRLYVASITGPVSRLVGEAPADCRAGFGRVIGDVLKANAGIGAANQPEVYSSSSNTEWVLNDGGAPLVAGPSCTQTRVNRIRCPKAMVGTLLVDSGDLRDKVRTPSGLDAAVEVGAGNDRAVTGDGTDTLGGGAGNDELDAGAGPDTLDGGADTDTALYSARGAGGPVDVSLDGVANDGGAADGGGQDNVLANVENVVGGSGADTLTGSAVRNALTGGQGADEIHGLAGNDVIRANGDGSVDTITCGQGSDHVFADPTDIFPVAGPDACEVVN